MFYGDMNSSLLNQIVEDCVTRAHLFCHEETIVIRMMVLKYCYPIEKLCPHDF
jgi:hypothetical protein